MAATTKKKATKKAKSSPTLRTLLKPIQGLGTTTTDGSVGDWGDLDTYEAIDVGGVFPCFVWAGWWDMSGFTVQDKTFVSTGAAIHDPGQYFLTNTAGPAPVPVGSGSMETLEVMTTVPLDETNVGVDMLQNRFPTFLSTEQNWEQVIFARYRGWAINSNNSNPGLLLAYTDQEFGSGEPSAADRIYLYRFLLPTAPVATAGDTLTVPPLRFLLGGVPIKEGDLEWIYRLRRSYLTQGSI